jgi:hypothetical protein
VVSTALSTLLQKILLIPIVGLWVFHLYQRRFKDAAVRKRIATLSLTAVLIAGWAAAWAFTTYAVDDRWLIVVAAAAVFLVIWQRKLMLPYRARCARCGKRLSLTRMLSWDSNTSEACEPPREQGERG